MLFLSSIVGANQQAPTQGSPLSDFLSSAEIGGNEKEELAT